MTKTLNILELFNDEARLLIEEREKAKRIHKTGDIKAAGNQVEEAVRTYFRRSLPSKYYITHGHLIDINGRISPQLDIIITDNQTLPSLLKAADGTEYVPATSVYAVGEIKSTYYKAQNYLQTFQNTLAEINDKLHRPLIENTKFEGLKSNTLLEHMIIGSKNKYLNNLFSFMLCIDGGDFQFEDIAKTLLDSEAKTIPSMISLLGTGNVLYAKQTENGFGINKYPQEQDDNYEWFFTPMRTNQDSAPAGSHLGNIYGQLMEHLTESFLEPAPVSDLLSELNIVRKSELVRASDFKT